MQTIIRIFYSPFTASSPLDRSFNPTPFNFVVDLLSPHFLNPPLDKRWGLRLLLDVRGVSGAGLFVGVSLRRARSIETSFCCLLPAP